MLPTLNICLPYRVLSSLFSRWCSGHPLRQETVDTSGAHTSEAPSPESTSETSTESPAAPSAEPIAPDCAMAPTSSESPETDRTPSSDAGEEKPEDQQDIAPAIESSQAQSSEVEPVPADASQQAANAPSSEPRIKDGASSEIAPPDASPSLTSEENQPAQASLSGASPSSLEAEPSLDTSDEAGSGLEAETADSPQASSSTESSAADHPDSDLDFEAELSGVSSMPAELAIEESADLSDSDVPGIEPGAPPESEQGPASQPETDNVDQEAAAPSQPAGKISMHAGRLFTYISRKPKPRAINA